MSLHAAFHGLHISGLRTFRQAATTAMAGILTALAVHAVG